MSFFQAREVFLDQYIDIRENILLDRKDTKMSKGMTHSYYSTFHDSASLQKTSKQQS